MQNKKIYFLDIPWTKEDCLKNLFEKGECGQGTPEHSALSFYFKKSEIMHKPSKIKEDVKDDDLILIFSNFDYASGELMGFTNLTLKNGMLFYSVKWPPFKDKSGNFGIKWGIPKPHSAPYEHFNVNRYGGKHDYPNLYELNINETKEILEFIQNNASNWNEIIEKIQNSPT